MKPIIMDMRDMSDSREVYESRPNPWIMYFTYLLIIILAVAVIWMWVSEIDIVVTSNGMFKNYDSAFEVSSNISGQVITCNITEGQYVNSGDVLFVIGKESLEETIVGYEELIADNKERMEVLKAYNEYLSGVKDALETQKDNKYYEEFAVRKELIEVMSDNSDDELIIQKTQMEYEINNAVQVINRYNSQISELNQAIECVKSVNNTFDEEDSYYKNLVDTYIVSWHMTASQYSDYASEEAGAALANLELNQVAALEQQINTLNNSLDTALANYDMLIARKNLLNDANYNNSNQSQLLSEKQSVVSEINGCMTKQTEYTNALKQYELEYKNAVVLAPKSGYVSLDNEICEGSFISQGTTVCRIISEKPSGFYAEIYVQNSEIGSLKVGQEVKFEIAAYPSSEYGYFTGVIESISKDIKVVQGSQSAYYLVKASCEQTTVTNQNGEVGMLMNGMACQAKVVVDSENVLTHLLKKIDLVD